jgi:hypothetical protein
VDVSCVLSKFMRHTQALKNWCLPKFAHYLFDILQMVTDSPEFGLSGF